MPSRSFQEYRCLPPRNLGQVIRQTRPEGRDADMFRLARDELDNGAGNTGESPLEVRRNDVDIGHPHHFAHHLRFATRERTEFSIMLAP